jgi:hypothetical protein
VDVALKMETVCFSETLVFTYEPTRHYNQKNDIILCAEPRYQLPGTFYAKKCNHTCSKSAVVWEGDRNTKLVNVDVITHLVLDQAHC